MNVRRVLFLLFFAEIICIHAQEPTWHEMKKKPGANFYEIKKAHEAQKENSTARSSSIIPETFFPNESKYYEQEEGFRFDRWQHEVEHRVADHNGDLSVLNITQIEKLKLVNLNGAGRIDEQGDWVNLGPYSENTGGAGRINWLEIHPNFSSMMMVGSPGGGVWMSYDEGNNWSAISDNIGASLGAAWGVYDPFDPSTIYLGTGDGNSGDTKSIGLLKSQDGGTTWSTTDLIYDVSDEFQIQKVAISPDGNILFVAATDGLHRSTDRAETFSRVRTGEFWDIEFKPGDPEVVFATTHDRLYRSTNGGETFTQISGISGGGNRVYVEVSEANPNVVYVLTTTSSRFSNLYISNNSGSTFSRTGSISRASCDQVWYDVGFAVSHFDEDVMALGCLDHYRSNNGGDSFFEIDGAHVDVHGFEWGPNEELYGLNDGGIYKSTGSDFESLNNNLSISQGYRIGVYKNDYDRICTGRQDNGTSLHANLERGFRRANWADGMECFFSLDGNYLYTESQRGGFRRCPYNSDGTIDDCTSISSGLPSGLWNTPWAHDPITNGTLYAGRGSSFYRSTNRGSSWSFRSQLSTSIRNFTLAPSDPDVVYAMAGSNVYRSRDAGRNFTDVWLSSNGTPIYAAVSKSDPDEVWVVVSGYTSNEKVYHSRDGGNNWDNETNSGLPNVPALSIVIHDNNANGLGIYVGTDAGVYYRDDRFNDWQNFSKNLALSSVRELEIAQKGNNEDDQKIVASTYGRGVWSSGLWDDVYFVPVKRPDNKSTVMRNFKTSYNNQSKILDLQFQLGRDKFISGTTTMRIVKINGEKVYQEKINNFGRVQKKIALENKGVYLLIVDGQKAKIQKRIAAF